MNNRHTGGVLTRRSDQAEGYSPVPRLDMVVENGWRTHPTQQRKEAKTDST